MPADMLAQSGLASRSPLGLQASGTNFLRAGQVFRGIGVNHFALVLNDLYDIGVGGIGGSAADITAIKSTWGLPFIRCAFGWYDRTTWYTKYYQQKATYFAALDAVVAKCEQLGIGLIPTLFWSLRGFTDMSYDVYGSLSPLSDLGTKSSNSWGLASTFISEVVSRYAASPAIWAWELSNEVASNSGPEYYSTWVPDGSKAAWLNWGTRPGGGNYLAADKMSMAQYRRWTQLGIELIHSLDTSGRLILNGSAIGNSFAVGAQSADTLTADALAAWNGSSVTNGLPWVIYRDQNFRVVSAHIYPQSIVNGTFFNGAEKTHAELIALHKGWADANNLPFFLEEFGATYHGDPVDQTSTDLATETANFTAALSAITANNIQLSAGWNYGGNLSGGSAWQLWKLADASRTYQLTAIAAANAAMGN